MKSISLYCFRIFGKRPALFSIVFVLILGFFIFQINTRLTLDEDILSSLPESNKLELLKKISERQKTNRLLGIDFTSLEEFPNSQFNDFDSLFKSSGFVDTTQRAKVDYADYTDVLLHAIPLHLQPTNYADLKQQLIEKRTEKLTTIRSKLYSIESMGVADLLFKDPFDLLSVSNQQLFKDLGTAGPMKSISFGEEQPLKFYNLNFDPGDIESGENLEAFLTSTFEKWEGDRPLHFGYYQISLANAHQIKKDTVLTSSLAGILILLLLLGYYRKPIIVFLFALPVVFGFAFSLGILASFNYSVSAISLGTGAAVIGIILDFSFHFYTHLRSSGSIKETLASISNPLSLGALTTICAFGALYFTSSKTMQDFGLFASLSILGAALFTLFVLPTIAGALKIKIKPKEAKSISTKNNLNKKWKYLMGVSILGTTLFLGYFALQIQFEDDLNSLNYFPEELKNNEAQIMNIDARQIETSFLFANGSNLNVAISKNAILLDQLKALHKEDSSFNYFSTAPLYSTPEKRKATYADWNNFWKSSDSLLFCFQDEAVNLGFTADAFHEVNINTPIDSLLLDSLPSILPIDLIFDSDTSVGIVNFIEYPRHKGEEYIAQLTQDPAVVSASKRDLASSLIQLLTADFNYVLFISIFIVALTLLMVYGRIELMLVTFLPMIISWVWILGIAVLLGIEFNFVNIIVCTFIFGLGDDFAIFITDGHLQEIRYGKKEMPVFKHAILLSAVTTIIGCGALWFAEHPALNSIAPLAVMGMGTILLISFIIQPWLFKLLITNRTEQGKPPLTFGGILISIFAFTYFLFGCILLLLALGLFIIFPAKKKSKREGYNWLLSRFARSLVYIMVNVKKTVKGVENLKLDQPSIVIANHQSFIDILAIIMLHPNIRLMTNKWVYNSPVFGWAIRYAGYIHSNDGYENNMEAINALIEKGYSVAIFPEGTRSKTGDIGRFHKGAFYLAEKLNVPILPVLLHGFYYTMPKGDYLLKNGHLTISILPPIDPANEQFGDGYRARTKAISSHFKSEFDLLKQELENSTFFYPRIKSNYDYRGPIVEWYFRIKWRFEAKNFDYYAQFIQPNDTLIDAGCGYGYFAFFLNYKYPKLRIDAIDLDSDKIAYAMHHTDRSDLLNFDTKNIEDVDYSGYSKIFFNDVLHYLSETNLNEFIDRLFSNLEPHQQVFIRDGNEDDTAEHKTTKLTEAFSTSTGFNKTTNELFFFGEKWLREKTKKHKLSLEIVQQNSKTSNLLYIVKWQE